MMTRNTRDGVFRWLPALAAILGIMSYAFVAGRETQALKSASATRGIQIANTDRRLSGHVATAEVRFSDLDGEVKSSQIANARIEANISAMRQQLDRIERALRRDPTR